MSSGVINPELPSDFLGSEQQLADEVAENQFAVSRKIAAAGKSSIGRLAISRSTTGDLEEDDSIIVRSWETLSTKSRPVLDRAA
jgi:hypothetical protein